MSNDAIGDRMKGYEQAARAALPRRMPVIVRVDGKAFHTWTRGCERPFDGKLVEVMNAAAIALCDEIQGAQMASVQSDEISVLVHNYKRYASSAWFDNEVQKTVSVSAFHRGRDRDRGVTAPLRGGAMCLLRLPGLCVAGARSEQLLHLASTRRDPQLDPDAGAGAVLAA